MGLFCSFLVFTPNQAALVKFLCSQAGWRVSFITDPSKRFRFSERGGWAELSQPSSIEVFGALRDGQKYGELLIIEAEQTEANNIVQLILAANIVLEGFPEDRNRNIQCFELPDDASEQIRLFEDVFQTTGFFEQFSFHDERPVAVAMAAKAWKDLKVVYAIHKLAWSYQTESVTPWSTHPRNGQIFEKHSGEYADHVGTSIAINLAFSAIEELGLKIKSREGKPRWLDKEYTWNPDVLTDINKRLEEAGIGAKRTIDWVVRGNKTELEIEPIRPSSSQMSDLQEIRDMEFSIPDAISACGYLRDKKTAHAFGSETHLLGPYEVYNVQQVVRLLILSKCNLWNTWTRDLRERLPKGPLDESLTH